MRKDWPFAEQMLKLRPPESRATGSGAAVPGGESESSDSNLDQQRSTFDSDSDSSFVVESNPNLAPDSDSDSAGKVDDSRLETIASEDSDAGDDGAGEEDTDRDSDGKGESRSGVKRGKKSKGKGKSKADGRREARSRADKVRNSYPSPRHIRLISPLKHIRRISRPKSARPPGPPAKPPAMPSPCWPRAILLTTRLLNERPKRCRSCCRNLCSKILRLGAMGSGDWKG